MGCIGTQKYPVNGYLRTSLDQICQDRVTHVLRQRQPYFAARLASYTKRCLAPVDVIDTHGDYVAATQPKTRQQQQDGAVSHILGFGHIARSDQALNIVRHEVARQCR
jgi:hypothetical protein